jgi:hypothetical protein|tara:strand:- start:2043 stop:2582 length:540 start_codon:yes stop_codon:yes gene_type:complete
VTHEELVLLVQKQQEEINRLNELVKRLYDISELPRLETEEKILAEIEAKAEVLANEETALRIQAAEGNIRAQFVLGYIYYHAKGVAEDSVQGVTWWHKAAEQGHAEAQWELGNAYVRGQGVIRDIATGYAWYSIAADSGFVFAKRDKEKIAQKMYPGDIIRAEEIAKGLRGSFAHANKI